MGFYLKDVKGYSFNGYISADELPTDVAEKLGVSGTEEVYMFGEFEIEWDDDIANVMVTWAIVRHRGVGHEFTDEIPLLDTISDAIADSGSYCDWRADQMAAIADSDYFEDR